MDPVLGPAKDDCILDTKSFKDIILQKALSMVGSKRLVPCLIRVSSWGDLRVVDSSGTQTAVPSQHSHNA